MALIQRKAIRRIHTQADLDAAVTAQRAANAAAIARATAKGNAGKLARIQAAAAAAVQQLTDKGRAQLATWQGKSALAKSKADARTSQRAAAEKSRVDRKAAKLANRQAKRKGGAVSMDPATYYGQQESNASPDNGGSITGGYSGGGGGGAGGAGTWDEALDGSPAAPVLAPDEFTIGGHTFNKKALIIGGTLAAAVGLIVVAVKHK
jgi:membrane protein involved in colicin uptake